MNRRTIAAIIAGSAVGVVAFGGSAVASNSNPTNKAAKTASVKPALIVPRAFAVVNANGTPVRGRGAVSVLRLGTGIYDVRFAGSIARCAWTGTTGFGQFSGSLPNGSGISVTGRAGTNNGVFVQTYVNSTSFDLPFTVLVVCS
jgi:hypothetical protein